jgi:hypothetical protein
MSTFPGKRHHAQPGGKPPQRFFELIPETGDRSKGLKNIQGLLQSYVTYDTLLRAAIWLVTVSGR